MFEASDVSYADQPGKLGVRTIGVIGGGTAGYFAAIALKKRFPDSLGHREIQESTETDYAYRIFVEKDVWARVLSEMALETDYDNFKSEVARHQGRAGAAYEHSLHRVWSVMHALQE